MVEQPSHIEGIGNLMRDLDQATKRLEEINKKPQIASKQELTDLIHVLKQLNANLEPHVWRHKKFAQEGMNQKIEKALVAIQVFQLYHPEKDLSGQRSVNQAITSLFSSLNVVLKKVNNNLKDLKKHRIGLRVEKTGESKQT